MTEGDQVEPHNTIKKKHRQTASDVDLQFFWHVVLAAYLLAVCCWFGGRVTTQ